MSTSSRSIPKAQTPPMAWPVYSMTSSGSFIPPSFAGLPETVITRAKVILKELENGKKIERPKKKKKEIIAEPQAQMSLLGTADSKVEDYLRNIDVNTLTPIEALNKIYELKNMLN